ncbi:MAG: hypothetical protein JST92_20320 [Deltaproteobacteria bacterium]|nr:hypothetical protein [Deltaproteobacteria bacterium]
MIALLFLWGLTRARRRHRPHPNRGPRFDGPHHPPRRPAGRRFLLASSLASLVMLCGPRAQALPPERDPVRTVTIVVDDQVSLRSSPRAGAPVSAVLSRGDLLELRGEEPGFLKVYDHQRERPGFVRPSQVRVHKLDAAGAAELKTIALFLRDQQGMEALGTSYALLARELHTDELEPGHGDPLDDAIAQMTDRLAARASRRWSTPQQNLADQLEAVRARGIRFVPREIAGQVILCTDGAAETRALRDGDANEAARAVLLLTQSRCGDDTAPPAKQGEWHAWRLDLLGSLEPHLLRPELAARVRLREAESWAFLAGQAARARDLPHASDAAEHALDRLLGVDRAALPEEAQVTYDEVAVRVSAARHAQDTQENPLAEAASSQPQLTFAAMDDGRTCLTLRAARAREAKQGAVVLEHCSYAVPWPSTARVSPHGDAVALVVSPTPTWTELWLLRRGARGAWALEVLPPAAIDPGVGAIELAGFTPDSRSIMVAREAMVQGKLVRQFEVRALKNLALVAHADAAGRLRAFARYAAGDWKSKSVALR